MADSFHMDSTVRNLLSGKLRVGEIPPIPARVVRVYLASTGEDTTTERNAFVQTVYPELREYCRHRYGVEFQIVDLDWGTYPEEDRVDHTLAEFRLREIQRCHNISAGPSFAALIGQRYGTRLLPASIPAQEYKLIRMALHSHKGRETRAAPLLDKWYTLDDNSIPPVYMLSEVEKHIPTCDDENETTRRQGRKQWTETEREIRRLLQKGAEYCYLEGLIDTDVKHKYHMSGIDSEVRHGTEENDDSQGRCVLIFRNIVDLKNYICDPKAPTFTEIIYNEKLETLEEDQDSARLLTQMSNTAKGLVNQENTLSFDVLWRYEEVISPKLHKDYLNKLCSQFHGALKKMIDENVAAQHFDIAPEIYEESLHHWAKCQRHSNEFFGREDILCQLQSYLQGVDKYPMVVYGEAGSGKTTLLSKLAMEAQDILQGDVITLIRYTGYTTKSKDIKQIMLSLCAQLLAALHREDENIPHDCKELQRFFHDLLQSIPESVSVVIFIDALDQVSSDYNAHFMSWLPSQLSENVKMVVSTLPDTHNILDVLRQEVLKNELAFLDISSMAVDEAEALLCFNLSRFGRQITEQQMSHFRSAFEKCTLPMYVQLSAEYARLLSSSSPVDESILPVDVSEAINKLFETMEGMFGYTLVSRAMGYTVASVTGLSDCEMEDLLSLDDAVLNSVYQDFHPPVRRIPFTKWLQLKDRLERFMYQKDADGVTVNVWDHEEFVSVIKQRYLSEEEIVKHLHSMLADYFLGAWAGKPKPVDVPKEADGVVLLPCGSEADRQVPSQPLTFVYDGHETRFNQRKYDQVPRHLYLAGRLQELNRLVLFNYEWLYNKIKALSLQHIMADFALNPGVEASLVEDALRVAEPTIERDINNMAPEISGHLLPYYATHSNIRALVRQCDTDGLKHCAFVPNFPYFQVPGSSLQYSLSPSVLGESFHLVYEDRHLVTKERDSSYIYLFDITTGESKESVFASNGELYVTPNGRHFVIVDHVTEKSIKLHKADTGAFVGQLIVMNHIQLKPKEKYKMGKLSLTNDRMCVIVTTETSYLGIADVDTCQFLQIVGLDGRSEICEIMPSGRFVFCNSNEFLLAYDLYTLEHVCTVSVGYIPNALSFTGDGFRAFLSNTQETKLMVLHIHRGTVEMAYKTVLDEDMPDDKIVSIKVSPKDDLVLVRGLHTILVYNRFNEKICAKFPRPPDVPKEFKLPKSHYTDLVYTQAEFSRDGNFVIGTIFRNIYIWQVSTQKLVTTIQAPVGIISDLLVSKKRTQIVTHLRGSRDIQVWNIDEAVNQINMLDKLTDSITDIQVTGDISKAFVKCRESDEIGVIDMQNGVMVDLLTHDKKVRDFAVTPDGTHALVSTESNKKNTANKIWNLTDRKTIKEFGDSTGFCVSFHTESSIIFVAQEEVSFDAPYYVNTFQFIADTLKETTHPLALKQVLKKPFVTNNDKYLVILTAQAYNQSKAAYETPTICTFSLEDDMNVGYFTPESFAHSLHVDSIFDLKPCPNNPYTVAVLFKSEANPEFEDDEADVVGSFYGVLILDICSGAINSICEPFLHPGATVDDKIIFSNDFSFCLDETSTAFDMCDICYRGQLPNPGVPPRAIALDGTVVVYYSGSLLYAVRLTDGKCIGTCYVHARICYLKLCNDDRTIVAGCEDGTVVSYVLVDPDASDKESVLSNMKSRFVTDSETDGRQSRAWDKVEENGTEYLRPPSAVSIGAKDKVLLKGVRHVPKIRPNSDTLIYLNTRSKTCSIM